MHVSILFFDQLILLFLFLAKYPEGRTSHEKIQKDVNFTREFHFSMDQS